MDTFKLVVHQPDPLAPPCLFSIIGGGGGGGGRYVSLAIIPDSSILLAYQQCHSPCDMLVVIIECYYCEHGLLAIYLHLHTGILKGKPGSFLRGQSCIQRRGGALVYTCSLN